MGNPVEAIGGAIQKIGSGTRRIRSDGWAVESGIETGVVSVLVSGAPLIGAIVGTMLEGRDILWDFMRYPKTDGVSKAHLLRRGAELLVPIAVTIVNPFVGAVTFGAIRVARGVDSYKRLKVQGKLRDVRIG